MTSASRAIVLGVMTSLFALRVAGQALVAFLDVTFLPPMEHWYSGVVPYPVLLPVQIVMLAVMLAIVRDFARGRGWFVAPRRRLGTWLRWFSYAYASSMVIRYAVTMTLYPERRWFGHTIPIWFHLVLAAFLYTLGRHHLQATGAASESPARA